MKSFFAFFKKRPYLTFLVPGLVAYSIFVIYPIFSAARISLYRWNGYGPKEFVGLQNYVELFSDPDMMSQLLNALKNSLILFGLTVVIAIPLQILMAYLIYSKCRGHRFFQVAIFSPQFISTPVIVFLFTMMFDKNIGLVNQIFQRLGLDSLARPWLSTPSLGIYIVWLMITWAGIGGGMIYFLGAMKMVSYDELESAYMEGAGFWKRLYYIVLPQIRATTINLVLISYIVAMTIFDYSYILGGTGGGIDRNVDVMALFFYRTAFGDTSPLGGKISENPMGMGTAIACVLFALIFIVALLQIVVLFGKREDDE